MKRPLLTAGVMFVLGELIYRLAQNSFVYSAGIITLIVLILVSNILRQEKKCLSMLLFLCLPMGALWGYGYYSDSGRLTELAESREKVCVSAYIYKSEKTESGVRLMLECDDGRMLAYVKAENADKKYTDKKYNAEKIENKKNTEKTEDSDNTKLTKKKNMNPEGDIDGIRRYLPGKYIKITGTLQEIKGCTNPGSMDSREYYAGLGVECEIVPDSVEIDPTRENKFRVFLSGMRLKLGDTIDEYFGTEDGAILKTMILGDRSDISSDTKLLFQRSGIAHILAISGLHVGLIAGIFSWLLALLRIRKKKACVIVCIFIIVYGLFTGFSPATTRAVIMVVILKMSFVFGRSPDIPTSMIEALLIMMIINPDCMFSTGLLMSFAAILGVHTGMVFYDVIFGKERFLKLPERMRGYMKKYSAGLLSVLSINIWMLPLIISGYYEVPVYAIALNFIIIPLLTIVVAGGMFVVVFGYLAGGLYPIRMVCLGVRYICSRIIGFYKMMCGLFLKLPGSVIITGHMKLWLIVTFYLCISLILFCFYRRLRRDRDRVKGLSVDEGKKGRRIRDGKRRIGESEGSSNNYLKRYMKVVIVQVTLMIVMITLTWFVNKRSEAVVFLDVGQGDGSIIHTADRNYIVDCGSSSSDKVGQYVLLPALKYYGVSRVDMIFISHTDADHVNGIIYLLENKEKYGVEVGGVAFAKGTMRDEVYERIETLVGEENILELQEGDVVESEIEVLYPTREIAESVAGDKYGGDSVDDFWSDSGGDSGDDFWSDSVDDFWSDSGGDSVDDFWGDSGGDSGDDSLSYSKAVSSHSGNDYSLVLKYVNKGIEADDEVDDEADDEVDDEVDDEAVVALEKNANKNSDFEILYTGDIGSEVEKKIHFTDGHQRKRILKCAHHGSKYSSSEEFIEGYDPDIAVISCGKNNMYGHPAPETLERLKEEGSFIYRTDLDGAVIIEY